MKTELLTRVEEKYVFSLSRHFWHAFVLIAGAGIIAGVLALIWGVIPAAKSDVTKEQYPPPVSVGADEVKKMLAQAEKAKRPLKLAAQPSRELPSAQVSASTAGEKEYGESLARLKKLLPPPRFHWKEGGHWEYPFGQAYYDYYKQEDYRKWVIDPAPMMQALDGVYGRVSAYDYASRKEIVDAYVDALPEFGLDSRPGAFEALGRVSRDNVSTAVSSVATLRDLAKAMKKGRLAAVTTVSVFYGDAPSDAPALARYAASIVPKFADDARAGAVAALVTAYGQTFYRNFTREQDATNVYVDLLPKLDAKIQAKAMPTFYDLYLAKNLDRERAVSEIDSKYSSALAAAEAAYTAEQEKKALAKKYSLYAVGGGIVVTALVALFLVLLSVQRYLKRIVELLGESTKTIPASDGSAPQPAPATVAS